VIIFRCLSKIKLQVCSEQAVLNRRRIEEMYVGRPGLNGRVGIRGIMDAVPPAVNNTTSVGMLKLRPATFRIALSWRKLNCCLLRHGRRSALSPIRSLEMKQTLGLSLALLLFAGGIWACVGGAGAPKPRARGCRTPTDEGDAANRPSGSTSLIAGEIGAICVMTLVEPRYPLSRTSRTPKKPGMTSTCASWLSSRSVYS
jgi:hypothetical protein